MNVESNVARALRALQVYDACVPMDGLAILHRPKLIAAETALGEQLGLTCTGTPSAWDDAGVVSLYDHDGETCPVHEWLVPDDHPATVTS